MKHDAVYDTIDRITLHARSAPKGRDLQIDLMKNGSA